MHPLAVDDSFCQSLRDFDLELFRAAKSQGCARCKGPRDTSNYYRKIRGMGEGNEIRFSLCCRREGCRKRLTPQSLRFFGRKIYSRWVILMAIDFAQELGLPKKILRQTLARWRKFWKDHLAESSPFMKWSRGFLSPHFIANETPGCIVSSFQFHDRGSWIPILKFFAQLI